MGLALALAAACGGSPSGPTAQPTPAPTPTPTPSAPALTCPGAVTASTITSSAIVSFTTPEATGGQAPVAVTCTPASGAAFPVGQTSVECVAKDALNRTASCTFAVTVAKAASLSTTRFLAFGDSLTAGEVTVPSVTAAGQGHPSFRLVLVPSAAYPTVLAKSLQARYPLQGDAIVVANYGKSGEKAVDARSRFVAALGTVAPEAVLLMEGANDIPLGEDGAASSAAFEIRAMAAEARQRGMRVFIATLPPGLPGASKAIPPFLLADYNDRMRAAAALEGAVLVDIFQALSTDVNAYIGVDGLHPNEAGYARMAETFQSAIRAAFEIP